MALVFLVLASQASADCTCRFAGGDVKEGQTACISTAKGPTLARCEKVLNVTSWTFLNKACTPQTVSSVKPDKFKLIAVRLLPTANLGNF